MKLIKKSIAIIIFVIMLFSLCIISASALVMSDSNFMYEVNFSTGEAVITSCKSDSLELVIPSYYSKYKIVGISEYAFENKQNLEILIFPATIRSVGNYAFSKCSSLRYITIPETVTYLGKGFCSGCASLEKAYVPAALTSLPSYSFSGCEKLTDVELNTSIASIGQFAFSGCSSLQSIGFANNLSNIDRIAFYQSGLETMDINEGITSIYDYTFAECPNLSSVIIPQTVTFIDPTAFSNDNNLTIFCYYQSYAHKYAVENNIPYIATANFMLGDVDGVDGININDVTAIQSHLAELKTVEGIYLLAADANQDDIVDISDATALQMKLAEYELPYPIGQYITKEIVSE